MPSKGTAMTHLHRHIAGGMIRRPLMALLFVTTFMLLAGTSLAQTATLTDDGITNNARAVAEFTGLSPLDRSIVFTPPQFAFAQSQIFSHLYAVQRSCRGRRESDHTTFSGGP